MDPERVIFKTHGSNDESNSKATGNEIWRIYGMFEYKSVLVISLIMTLISGITPLYFSIALGDMSTIMASSLTFMDGIKSLLKTLLYLIILVCAVNTIKYSLKSWAIPSFMYDIRSKIFSNLMEQTIEYYDQTQTGVLISRLSEDVTLVQEVYFDKSFDAVEYLAQSLGGVILAFLTSWVVTLICAITIPIILLVFWLCESYVSNLWSTFNDRSTTAATKAEEVINQFRTVKSYDCEMAEFNQYSNGLDGIYDVYCTASIAHGIKGGINTFLSNATVGGVIFLASYYIVRDPSKGLEYGDLTLLLMSLLFAAMGFSQALSFVDDLRKANVAASKLLDIIDLTPGIDRNSGETLESIHGKIEFRNVGFKYATREEWAVRNLNFSINPGETVAIVGESGCGKTTALSLLQRFYEITEGQIFIDDVEIRNLSQTYLRSQIAIVPQSPVLFSMTIRDNIRYANPEASDSTVGEAAQIGNASDFIMALEKNYETEVTQVSLSGGQKQRICISRAILAKAPILLLDEATAALDTESEQLVQQSLDTYRKGKTAIVVAHRLSTVKNADRIIVIANGQVVESGTHEELLAKDGSYANLVKFQLQ